MKGRKNQLWKTPRPRLTAVICRESRSKCYNNSKPSWKPLQKLMARTLILIPRNIEFQILKPTKEMTGLKTNTWSTPWNKTKDSWSKCETKTKWRSTFHQLIKTLLQCRSSTKHPTTVPSQDWWGQAAALCKLRTWTFSKTLQSSTHRTSTLPTTTTSTRPNLPTRAECPSTTLRAPTTTSFNQTRLLTKSLPTLTTRFKTHPSISFHSNNPTQLWAKLARILWIWPLRELKVMRLNLNRCRSSKCRLLGLRVTCIRTA